MMGVPSTLHRQYSVPAHISGLGLGGVNDHHSIIPQEDQLNDQYIGGFEPFLSQNTFKSFS
jgi:hypothetical protein